MDMIFISYSFTDNNSKVLCEIVRDVAKKLHRVTVVEGRNLNLGSNFSEEIARFIKESAACVVAIFTADEKAKPNVLYELGIAVGAGKDVILIAEVLEQIPSMLKTYDFVVLNRNELGWESDFRLRLEYKFRRTLQTPEDHLVEAKLDRRYLPEERKHLRDETKVKAAIKTIKAGDLSKAAAILNILLQKEPHNFDAWWLLADCYYLQGCSHRNPFDRDQLFLKQYETALKALELAPNHILLLHSKGQAQLRLGKLDEAISTFESVLARDPAFSLAHYNTACILSLQWHNIESLRFLSEAIKLNPIWRDFAKGDPDFAMLWDDQDWIDLVYS